MTSRERLSAAIEGHPTDRLAWAPELNDAFINPVIERMDGDTRFILGSEEIPVGAELESVRRIGELINQHGPWG